MPLPDHIELKHCFVCGRLFRRAADSLQFTCLRKQCIRAYKLGNVEEDVRVNLDTRGPDNDRMNYQGLGNQ